MKEPGWVSHIAFMGTQIAVSITESILLFTLFEIPQQPAIISFISTHFLEQITFR